MNNIESQAAVQPLQAARQVSRLMFSSLMPGNTGNQKADELADKIYEAVEFEKCPSNVPTGLGDDRARWCCMVVGHTSEFHQSADGWMWTERHAQSRMPGFLANDWRNQILAEVGSYLSDHHKTIAGELIATVRITDVDHAHHGVIAAANAVRDMIVPLNNEPFIVDATRVLMAEMRTAALSIYTSHQVPRWRQIITDSESPTGVALVCTAEGIDDQHPVMEDSGQRDEDGVYDCCSDLHFEVNNQALAAYLVAVLNADADRAKR